MEDQLTLGQIIGDVEKYAPEVVPEVEAKEMIGKFPGRITVAELKTGETNGKDWARVNLRIECTEDGLEGRLAFINMFLGTEPPLYPQGETKSQTELFLDTMKTAGLDFEDKSVEGFETSVANLVGQSCMFKSWHKKKKNSEGKYIPQYNDKDYKVLAQKLIAPNQGNDEPTGNPYLS